MQDDPNFWACLERLDSDLDPAAAALVEASFTDARTLRSALETGTAAAPGIRPAPRDPPPMYLTRVLVQGFRGIGVKAELKLDPGPGLTVVVGRNGCGKSSFAEGLELALTGTNSRWTGARSDELRAGWRNLHRDRGAHVEVRLSEGRNIRLSWPDDAEDPEGYRFTASLGDERFASHAELGWGDAVRVYNPILTYAGLGDLARRSGSELYDQLGDVLGLGTLLDAQERIDALKKEVQAADRKARNQMRELKAQLETVDDERAPTALKAFRKRPWDLATLDALTRGSSRSETELKLQTLCQIEAPGAAPELVAALRDLQRRERDLEHSQAGQSQHLADLLRHTLTWHTAEAPCPVCGEGILDDAWRARVQGQLAQAENGSRAARALKQERNERLAEARTRMPAPPMLLKSLAGTGLADGLQAAWTRLHQSSHLADLPALADHLERCLPAVDRELAQAQQAARERLEAQDATWAPVAEQIRAWLPTAREAVASRDHLKCLDAAKKELLRLQKELVAERFAPVADRAKAIWEVLRQRSHVELTDVTLDGARTNNRRRVELKVTVDGQENTALGVMSQGELHSLALSLFLPRLTHERSPFRFLVLDDPVQAMDPYKVDGLARVLEEAAKDRQVVVFTHDARLPESIRRLRIDAQVFRVERGPRSVVQVEPDRDPVLRYLDEARAVSKNATQIGRQATRRVVPLFCRSALEAFFERAYRRREVERGTSHEEIEEVLQGTRGTTALAALALFGTTDGAKDVHGKIKNLAGSRGMDVYQAIKSGSHEGWDHHHEERIRATRQLMRDLERAVR